MKILGILVAIVLAITSNRALAQSEFVMPLCPIATIDGTQALENAFEKGECNGKPKKLVRVADFQLEVLCSRVLLSCVHLSEMNAKEQEYYNKLKRAVSSIQLGSFHRRAQTDGKTYRIEMLSGTTHSYTPAKHAIRAWDYVLGKACVMSGELVIGCIPILPPD